ncbi:MAG: HAMP domain-containing histidine kinase, partial [Chloroflexota bacterium]|nr:HAMP domain-containing histidine kinase [Chloroflexota bacterium]
PDAAPLRRVGWRLAALTVGLLCALLLVLGLSIYITTQDVLLGSLQATVKGHATAALTGAVSPSPGSGHDGGSSGSSGFSGFSGSSGSSGSGKPLDPDDVPPPPRSPGGLGQQGFGDGVFTTVVDSHLSVIFSDPPISATLADPAAARAALAGHLSSPYSTQQVNTDGPYLIYTARGPVRNHDGTMEPGVAQARISEQQYLDSLRTLLIILLAVSGAGLIASAVISVVLAGHALQPIRAALRRQRDFVADAAHELRTPLAIIRGASELGLAAGIGPDQEASLEQTLAQNAHLTRLVEDLSTLARADSGAVDLARAPVDLSRLVTETVAGVSVLAEERGVRLTVEAEGVTPVVGDALRLRQALLILLDNALKYTPDGGAITVSVTRQGGQVRLRVQDSGPGLAPEDLPHLFERFYRADKARGSAGSGLGLSIGRWIAEAHGGRITAANAPERGALFTITLPLAAS